MPPNSLGYGVVGAYVSVLTDGPTPRQYRSNVEDQEFKNLRGASPDTTEIAIVGWQVSPQIVQPPKSLFRIIRSIPRKAEPFKRLLAKVVYELVQGIEDLELAQKRMKEIYNLKRCSDECAWKGGPRNCSTLLELTDECDH